MNPSLCGINDCKCCKWMFCLWVKEVHRIKYEGGWGNNTKVALETPSLYKGDIIRVEGKRQKMSRIGCD